MGESWLALSDDSVAHTLLGKSFGPDENMFDPGRMGSYFQTPKAVSASLSVLSADTRSELADFVSLLRESEAKGLGTYVTF